ncbi:MAG: tyrosine-protein phosphatase [Clostridia bacterium]|nr:tyrosine-protein phosphatase [Clostridia bacterium]
MTTQTTGQETPECCKKVVLFHVSEDREFGSVRLDNAAKAFEKLGFRYGDSLDITFESGPELDERQLAEEFFNGYYGRTGTPVAVRYMGASEVLVAYCFGDAMWQKARCAEYGTASVKLNTKQKYLFCQQAMDLIYSEELSDFPSREAFSNFRMFSVGNVRKNAFFRGASPVNDVNRRAFITDGLIAEHGVRFILDLADTERKFKSYAERESFRSRYALELCKAGRVAFLGLTAAYRQEVFRRSLIEGLTEMMKNEGPVYIQCTEGKDRTGFVCLLLGALCGADIASLERDYMETYAMYYGITAENDPEKYGTILMQRFYDMALWLAGTSENELLTNDSVSLGARRYFKEGGAPDVWIDSWSDYLS